MRCVVVALPLLLSACEGVNDLRADAADALSVDGQAGGDGPVVDAGAEPDACLQRTFYPDVDGDGLGDGRSPVTACTRPPGYVENGDDDFPECAANFRDACGVCDGPGPRPYYSDVDGDGLGDPENGVVACARPATYVDNDDDLEPQ